MPRGLLRAPPPSFLGGLFPRECALGADPSVPSCWVAQPQRPQALAQPATTNDDVSEMALVPWGPWQAGRGQDVEGGFVVTLLALRISCGVACIPHNHL